MSTLRVNTLLNRAGTDSPTLSGTSKAWVNFNGTGTVAIRASYNVSSITDNGTGDYTVNFINPMSSVDYCVVMFNNADSTVNTATAFSNQWTGGMGSFTAGSVRVTSYYTAFADSSTFMVSVFR